MAHLTAEEAKSQHIEKMGRELGEQFSQLWQELAYLHANWAEYVILFGTKPERVRLLNDASPAFFRMLQDELWAATLLHIAKLTDQPVTGGQANLTFRNFSDLIQDAEFKKGVAGLIDEIVAQTKYAKQWRNKRIAHLDLELALDSGTAEVLEGGSRKQVKESLELMAKLMNTVADHYGIAPTAFNMAERRHGALELIYLLDDGLRARAKQLERLEKGQVQKDDSPARDL
ncbi:MAG TPA: hypothetical protein VK438_10840 [Xanthobacteraceae bacterium]|nr:hypothetical protein [Xanthobacteraceae bacterium]